MTKANDQTTHKGTIEERARSASRPGSPLRGRDVLLVVVLTAAILVPAGFLVRDVAATLGSVLGTLLLQSAVPLVVVQLLLVRGRGISWRDIGMRPASGRWYLWSLITALLTAILAGAMNAAIQSLSGVPFRNPQLELLAPAGFSWHGLVGMLLGAAIVAPIAEEVVFRGLLYGWLRRHLGIAASTAVSAIVFSFAHGIFLLVPVLFLQGAILALFYERSGSLWPSIVLHGMFNAIMLAVLYAALAAGVRLT